MPFSAVCSGSTLFAILNSLIRLYTNYHSQQSDQGLHFLPFSAVWIGSTLFAFIFKQYYQGLHCLPFSAVLSGSTLFAILSNLIEVCTVCHSQQSDQNLHYFPSSFWSVSKLFTILSSLISVYSFCHSFLAVLWRSALFAILSSLIRVYNICYSQQSDQGLHFFTFSVVRSGCPLFAILSLISVYTICHSFWAVWSRSILFAILSILTRVYITCHSMQSDQGLQSLPFSAAWSGSTLFAILNLIRVYTICDSQQSHQSLQHLRFFLSSIISSLIRVFTVCHSQLSGHGLHYLIFSVWSASTLCAVFSILIRVYTICHSFYSAWSRTTLFAILRILIRVYNICHFQESEKGLHYLPYSAVWSGFTLFAILSMQHDQGLHCLSFLEFKSGSTLLAILSSLIKVKGYTVIHRNNLIRVYTICHSQQSGKGIHYLPFSAIWSRSRSTLSFSRTAWSGSTLFVILKSLIWVFTVCHFQQSNQRVHCLSFSAV